MTTAAKLEDDLAHIASEYKRQGVYHARGIVPTQLVDNVFAEMHQLFIQQLQRLNLPINKKEDSESVHENLKTLFNHDTKTYIATLSLCAKLTSLYELYMHPNVKEMVRAIGLDLPVFQTAPVMHLMSKALKIPDGYQGFGVHQDWPTLQGSLDTVTLWIPFVDVDENLFTLDHIPGSHTRGLLPYQRQAHIFEVDSAYYDDKAFVPVEAKRGDIFFMSSFIVHRSSLRGDHRLRVSTSWRYENAAEKEFIRRAYPFAQKRSVIGELITPGFPIESQVRATYE
jgi:hypothetical protein